MLRKFIVLFLLSFALGSSVKAGVTLHYEGTAASRDAIAKILAAVTAFAKKNPWQIEDASAAKGRLQRVIDEKDKDYEGKITGVVIRINDHCEPLHFQFGADLFMQDRVKTQFAGADVHIQIVQLLESLRPLFEKMDVVDEGEYWALRDKAVLEAHIAKIDSMIADHKEEESKGPRPVEDEVRAHRGCGRMKKKPAGRACAAA